MPAPHDAHEWVSFEDPDEDRTWLIDVTFLTSSWHCVFGAGCQGVLTERASALEQGCCSYGAHFTDDEDVRRVEAAAAGLDDALWQFAEIGRQGGVVHRSDGTSMTMLVEEACIFLNRPGFAAGSGCALHLQALARGVSHVELKPDVCWQLPLRREDTVDERGHVTSTVGEWQRRHWGDAGEEFAWWCTEAPEAFGAREPVYRALAVELQALVGVKVTRRLRAYLDDRDRGAVPLPHPAVRKRRTAG